MNLAPLGPFTPVLGQKIAVIPGGQYAGPAQLGQVRLVNLSGFSCSVSSSSEGDLPDLAPFTTMVYDAPARGGSLSLTPVSGSAVVPAPQITGQLYVDGGTFPGTYPQTLPVTVVDIAAGATVDIAAGATITVQTAAGTPISNLPVAPESIISAELGGPGATLIAGVAGKSIYLHHVAYTIQSPDTSLTSPGVIQGSNAGAVICYVNPSVPGQVIPLGGYALALGESLDWLTNSFPAGLSAYTTITYTIA